MNLSEQHALMLAEFGERRKFHQHVICDFLLGCYYRAPKSDKRVKELWKM